MRIIDLSQPLVRGRDIACEIPDKLPVYLGYACEEYKYVFRSHVGCYFETSAHLFRGARTTEDTPIEQFFMPALVPRLDKERDGAIEPEEIVDALETEVRPGDALVVDTQGSSRRHFSRGCGAWMADNEVSLLGATLRCYDTGFTDPTGVFIELFRAEIPIIAGLQNVEEISHERFFLVALPLNVEGICTAPCRVVAIDGDPDETDWLVQRLRSDLARRT